MVRKKRSLWIQWVLLLVCALAAVGCAAEGTGPEWTDKEANAYIFPVDPDRGEIMRLPLLARGGTLTGSASAVTGQEYTYSASTAAERFMVYRLEENAYSPVYLERNVSSIRCTFYEPGTYLIQAGGESLTVTVSKGSSGITVSEKVDEIAALCPSNVSAYDKALWLHDWLTENANYDNGKSMYGPEGVLLLGYGVCDSYSKAYVLLCSKFGIECRRIIGTEEMNHAWNLICLDDEWYQVDVTWDDPVSSANPNAGGGENHDYFCATDEIMSRDHDWEPGGYPECTSLRFYHPIHNGMTGVSTEEGFYAALAEMAQGKTENGQFINIGGDASLSLSSCLSMWMMENKSLYSISDYQSTVVRKAVLSVSFTYSDTPVEQLSYEAPAFSLDSPDGKYASEGYSQNSRVMIFGDSTSSNTKSLLNGMKNYVPYLYERGVDVLVCLMDVTKVSQVAALKKDYGEYHFTYGDSNLMWAYANAVGITDNLQRPSIYMVDASGKIYYYSVGYVSNVQGVYNQALRHATGNQLPQPDTQYDPSAIANASGNARSLEGNGIVKAIQGTSGPVYVLIDYNASSHTAKLNRYEEAFDLYDTFGMSMIASFYSGNPSNTDYPHITFVEFDIDDFWSLLGFAGHSTQGASYSSSYLFKEQGELIGYSNGSVFTPDDCIRYLSKDLRYESTLPRELKSIEGAALSNTDIHSLDLSGTSVERIGEGAFSDCSGLQFIRIPESVAEIGTDAVPRDTIIVCKAGSEALYYAAENGINYIIQ